jgi:hypothetical protein
VTRGTGVVVDVLDTDPVLRCDQLTIRKQAQRASLGPPREDARDHYKLAGSPTARPALDDYLVRTRLENPASRGRAAVSPRPSGPYDSPRPTEE